jgi:hypothetical protein
LISHFRIVDNSTVGKVRCHLVFKANLANLCCLANSCPISVVTVDYWNGLSEEGLIEAV